MTCHANIFAILFHIATQEEQEKILANVIKNDAIPAITTPYFNFFELDMLARQENWNLYLNKIRNYWAECWIAVQLPFGKSLTRRHQ